ncbi:carbohydrate ABC transporter permease [Kitasatospora sp. YST-16]|uniref:carbohydrate ABC transporter permease n=1 Tax=unclassified Kitasatospora TaxID=2633591 RepID=UPI0004C36796|nr:MULTISPECIES: carbohydrate ABC transporter permease [unclassified Kitasatospora]WAL74773.1 carbohydrate ABC transporter permease [Kitasatospora sp. YST-16]WNW40827.1 carbohydrate ABC transporter permease [Streptomyces sp. Li-HN-5-13]
MTKPLTLRAPAPAAAPGPAGGSGPQRSAPRRPRRAPALLSRAAVTGLLGLAALYTLLPMLWLLLSSTKSRQDLFGTNGFAPGREFALLDNLGHLFRTDHGIYLRWIANTVLYAGGGALLATVFAVAAGYAFDKLAFPLKEKLFGFVLLGVMVPGTALAIPLYLLAARVGLVNTFAGVFLAGLVFPFGVYLARVFSAAYVPDEVLEAARMDGAGEFRAFCRIALPMLAPAFVTIFLFQFTQIWNSFFLPLVMLSDKDLFPVNLGLYVWYSSALSQGHPQDYLLAVVGSLVSVAPLVVLFLMLQRFWKSGMTAGAVK